MILSIHTIFVLRENILFIEEWIEYHISIGFDKFYLYDNSRSIGRDGSNQDINKYNIDFRNLTKDISDEMLQELLIKFLSKYENTVIYELWEPKDQKGNIAYKQIDGINHYIKTHGAQSQWTAFLDIDEFIFCAISLKTLLTHFSDAGAGCVVLHQKKFDDRFNNLDSPVTGITACIDNIDTKDWGAKCIVKNECFDVDNKDHWTVHYLPVKNCKIGTADFKVLRFNHYNINDAQLEWMKFFYKTEINFSLNGICKKIQKKFKYNLKDRILV